MYANMFSCLPPIRNYCLFPGCKQPRGETFLPWTGSLFYLVSDTIQLVTIHIWRMSQSEMVKILDTAVGGGVASETIVSSVDYWHPAYGANHLWLELAMLSVHGDMFSCLLHAKMIIIRQCQGYAVQWRIVPAQNQLAVLTHVWC